MVPTKNLTKLALTLPCINKKYVNFFSEGILPKKSNLIVGCLYKSSYMDICKVNDHYLNPLLDNLSNQANETIFLLGEDINNCQIMSILS